ncbi:MAG: AraC family transcriptional regulator [Burkholderiaceae bacterium]|nr:AraC family transcriptional regulator [Sulfuritalea sp.]MCF8173726.1 AraC family transcriptional regulator [Burkholderiaceae bacterium]
MSAEDLLEHADIATSVLHDRQSRIPVARYAALYRLINERLDDEGFALFSRPLRRGSFEFLCRAVLSAATLEEALERIARFLQVLQDNLDVELESSGDAAVIVISQEQALPVGPAGRVFAFEWLLRMIHGLAAWLVAHPLPLDEVCFPYPPPLHAADYELVFAPRYTFDAPRLEARFPAEWLALPVRRDEAALRDFLLGAPASITTLYRRDRALSLRVREYLRAALPEHLLLPAIARRVLLSPRTLHRRLEDEGTSFRAIKDGLRRELATEWLTKSDRPLGRIGAELGFADAAAFYRAFAGWTGSGPRDYRKRFGQ